MPRKPSAKPRRESPLGLEARLWAAADALRNNMDAAEYKHVVLGLIFLKYISDAFEAKHAELAAQVKQGADAEDQDDKFAGSEFGRPKGARRVRAMDGAHQSNYTTYNDRHPDLKADYVLSNPPFNDSDWRGELLKDDKRWVYGVPPASWLTLRIASTRDRLAA